MVTSNTIYQCWWYKHWGGNVLYVVRGWFSQESYCLLPHRRIWRVLHSLTSGELRTHFKVVDTEVWFLTFAWKYMGQRWANCVLWSRVQRCVVWGDRHCWGKEHRIVSHGPDCRATWDKLWFCGIGFLWRQKQPKKKRGWRTCKDKKGVVDGYQKKR